MQNDNFFYFGNRNFLLKLLHKTEDLGNTSDVIVAAFLPALYIKITINYRTNWEQMNIGVSLPVRMAWQGAPVRSGGYVPKIKYKHRCNITVAHLNNHPV